ncbi:MAG: hypothetical protein HY859_07895 [Caulobacterales bacterium]|nr:hypothetical protein [Caulobacterales bacterium]
MTTHFTCDAEIVAIGGGVVARTLPKPAWTHAAHFAAAVWLIAGQSRYVAERDMPGLIRAYNTATGVQNTDSEGYHETITQASLRATRAFLASLPRGTPLFTACNALLATELGRRDWLLAYWSRERLFSVEARRGWVEPDVAALPF